MKKLIFASLCAIIFTGCDGDWLPQPLTSDPDVCTVYYKDGTVEEIPCYYVYIDEPVVFGHAQNLIVFGVNSKRTIRLSEVKSWSTGN